MRGRAGSGARVGSDVFSHATRANTSDTLIRQAVQAGMMLPASEVSAPIARPHQIASIGI